MVIAVCAFGIFGTSVGGSKHHGVSAACLCVFVDLNFIYISAQMPIAHCTNAHVYKIILALPLLRHFFFFFFHIVGHRSFLSRFIKFHVTCFSVVFDVY